MFYLVLCDECDASDSPNFQITTASLLPLHDAVQIVIIARE